MNTAQKGFDNEKYITEQTAEILQRVERFTPLIDFLLLAEPITFTVTW